MNRINTKNTLQFLIHFIAWGLVAGLPLLIFGKDDNINLPDKMLHHGGVVLSMMLVFYLNYSIFIDKILFQRKIGKFLFYNLLLILLVGTVVHFWQEATMPPPAHIFHMPRPPKMHHELIPMGVSFLIRDLITLFIIAGLSIAVRMTGKWYTSEVERQEEEKKRTEAELSNLRQQINPHFLFNTLNNIYALIAISPEKAQDATLELSKLLRYVLYENSDNFVSLDRELNFVHNYVELMRIRLQAEVDLKMYVNVSVEHKTIAPLLFIPLIENAFKHGTSPDKQSFIHISIQDINNKEIRCMIKNSYFPKSESDQSGSGIGLENLRRRLEILYADRYILRTEKEGKTFVAELIVPLNQEDRL